MSLFEELKRRNVIRVGIAYVLIAWLVLQAADFGLDLINAPNWVIQALFLLAAIGLPAVLVFSWVFEMTPEGLKREQEVNRDTSITGQTGQKLNRVIISVLVLAVAYLLVDKFMLDRPDQAPASLSVAATESSPKESAHEAAEPSESASVAVLPFLNMSGDPENEYFSDGLTETLLHMLAQLPELRVAARTSSFAFKGKDAGIEEIAATLNVAHILEGSVQKVGNRVRVTAQLIRADDGFHVWSQNYTRPLEDIFAIQDEIARDVAGSLDASLVGRSESLHGVDTRDMSAYETYLKALEQQALFSYASLPAADNLFKEALAIDPGFIDAKLGLVRNQYKMMVTGVLDNEAAWTQSKPLIDQVLAEDTGNVSARILDHAYRIWFSRNALQEEVESRVNELRNLLPLAPTETFLRTTTASVIYHRLNDADTALALIEAGLLIDPLDADILGAKGEILAELEQFDEAEKWLVRAIEQRPSDSNAMADLADLKHDQGDLAGQLGWLRRSTEADPRDHELAGEIAELLYDLDLVEEGHEWARRVLAQAPQSDVGRKIALLQALADEEYDRALEMARTMLHDGIAIRHGSLLTAVFGYARLMAVTGRAEEGLAFFREIRPSAMAFDGEPVEFSDLFYLRASGEWLPLVADPETRAELWQAVNKTTMSSAPGWLDIPRVRLWDAMMLGDIELGRTIALNEIFSAPVTQNLTTDKMFDAPALAPLAADPEIRAELTQLERRKSAARDEVRELLLQPEWSD